MPLRRTNLGYVLLHIYEFPFEGTIYLPDVRTYEVDTSCIVAWVDSSEESFSSSEALLHQTCLGEGFKNWLNVAVVSDTCDEATEPTEAGLIAAFNEDCRENGWLRGMMNYRQ